MFIENFDKIYTEKLFTSDTLYEIGEDSMTIAPNHHTLRLTPISGKGTEPYTVVLMKKHNSINCGLYHDRAWSPIEIFDMNKLDLQNINTFKKLLSAKIENYE